MPFLQNTVPLLKYSDHLSCSTNGDITPQFVTALFRSLRSVTKIHQRQMSRLAISMISIYWSLKSKSTSNCYWFFPSVYGQFPCQVFTARWSGILATTIHNANQPMLTGFLTILILIGMLSRWCWWSLLYVDPNKRFCKPKSTKRDDSS
jgi:hypothetical protein